MQTPTELGQESADAIYTTLCSTLEPEHNGKYVVIHPASGDYIITEKRWDGMLALWRKHPEGGLVQRVIGPPTADEVRYAERLEMERRIYECQHDSGHLSR